MRTNIVIDDQLMKEALRAGSFKTKKEAVERGLELVAQLKAQSAMRKYRGKLKWKGDLHRSRMDKK